MSVKDVKHMIEVLVPDEVDRRYMYDHMHDAQIAMGLRDVGPKVRSWRGKRKKVEEEGGRGGRLLLSIQS
jgi:hypothetical protein